MGITILSLKSGDPLYVTWEILHMQKSCNICSMKGSDRFSICHSNMCSVYAQSQILIMFKRTRPDTRLPKSRAGGQGPYLRSLHRLGRSSGVKKIIKKSKTWRTTRPTYWPTDKAGCRVACTRLKMMWDFIHFFDTSSIFLAKLQCRVKKSREPNERLSLRTVWNRAWSYSRVIDQALLLWKVPNYGCWRVKQGQISIHRF